MKFLVLLSLLLGAGYAGAQTPEQTQSEDSYIRIPNVVLGGLRVQHICLLGKPYNGELDLNLERGPFDFHVIVFGHARGICNEKVESQLAAILEGTKTSGMDLLIRTAEVKSTEDILRLLVPAAPIPGYWPAMAVRVPHAILSKTQIRNSCWGDNRPPGELTLSTYVAINDETIDIVSSEIVKDQCEPRYSIPEQRKKVLADAAANNQDLIVRSGVPRSIEDAKNVIATAEQF